MFDSKVFEVGESVVIKATGEIGVVTAIDHFKIPTIVYVGKVACKRNEIEKVTVMRALEEAHNNMTGRHEKGDIVIITGGAYHSFKNGEVCAIVSGPDRQGDYRMVNVRGVRQFVSPEHFVPKKEEWFTIRARKGVTIDGYHLRKGATISAKRFSHDAYMLSFEEGHLLQASESTVNDFFYRGGDETMGAELYGYPPEREHTNEPAVSEEVYRKTEKELALARAEIRKLQETKEKERLACVDEEYGEVTERHLWKVEIYVKPSYGGFMRPSSRGGSFSVEVITSTTSVMEAAIAAETLAKRKSEDARVDRITYERDINAIK